MQITPKVKDLKTTSFRLQGHRKFYHKANCNMLVFTNHHFLVNFTL